MTAILAIGFLIGIAFAALIAWIAAPETSETERAYYRDED